MTGQWWRRPNKCPHCGRWATPLLVRMHANGRRKYIPIGVGRLLFCPSEGTISDGLTGLLIHGARNVPLLPPRIDVPVGAHRKVGEEVAA